jgi:hypothetical protein
VMTVETCTKGLRNGRTTRGCDGALAVDCKHMNSVMQARRRSSSSGVDDGMRGIRSCSVYKLP